MDHKVGSERHTFGSDPHVREKAAVGTLAPPLTPLKPQTGSTRPTWWLAARERVAEMADAASARIMGGLLNHVEHGWKVVEQLEAVTGYDPTHTSSAVAQLLWFVRTDVLDAFATLASASANTARAFTSDAVGPDPEQITREADAFGRSACVAFLASSDPLIPDALRCAIRPLCEALYDWTPDFSAFAAAAARLCRASD
jgi:hypothetical protein